MDNREKGYTLFKKGLKYKEIAEKLGVPESTVKSWATRYWKKGKAASDKGATKRKKDAPSDATSANPKHRGGQPGNVNSVGNKGGAPPGNQNALKHGGYSAILFDTLDDEEKQLIELMPSNEEQMLIEEIQILTIRERRILKRIEEHKKTPISVSSTVRIDHKREFDSEEDKALYTERIKEKVQSKERLPGREYDVHNSAEASYSIILKLEEALTRCQAQKQRDIDSLIKLRQSYGSKHVALADDWINGVLESMEENDVCSDD